MSDEKSEQESTANQVEGKEQCGHGCNCGTTGLKTKGKAIICLVVVLAAAGVLAHSFTRKAESKSSQPQEAFAAVALVSPAATNKAMETKPKKSSLWSEPLKDMASLNEVAAQKNAVFVYLEKTGQKPNEAIKRNIEQAANKSKSKGMAIGFYTLDDSSQDYAQITSQAPAPCVLAIVKGGGTSAVTGDITEEKLLAAIVAASRPSSCGPSGCGPSSDGCN